MNTFWIIYIVGFVAVFLLGIFLRYKLKGYIDTDGFFWQVLPAILFSTTIFWPIMVPMLFVLSSPYIFACIMIRMKNKYESNS